MARVVDLPDASLSVVMPCYNEVVTIETCLAAVLEQSTVGEVIIVDDGSTDGTREILAGLSDERVRVLLQPRNQGKGAALRTGFAAATLPYVIVQDADLEYDPSEFPKVIGPLVAGDADVVYGSRFAGGEAHRVLFFWHSMGNKLLTLVSNMFTDLNLTDMETCYKAFRREVIQSIEIEEDRFGFEPEVTARLLPPGGGYLRLVSRIRAEPMTKARRSVGETGFAFLVHSAVLAEWSALPQIILNLLRLIR